MNRRVLITSCGSTTALSVAKSLSLDETDPTVIGTDMYPASELPSTPYISTMYTVPPYQNSEYIDRILTICKKESITHVLPILDQEVYEISKHADMFRQHAIIVCSSDFEAVKICNDKYLTARHLASHNIDVPPAFLPNDQHPKANAYFLKPRSGVSSADCYVAKNEQVLEALLQTIPNPIIQEFLTGQFHVLDVVADKKHTVVAVVAREELQSKAGVGTKAITVDPTQFVAFAQTIVSACKIIGLCNIELFVDAGALKFVEINPRPSAGCILSATAGVNVVCISLDVFDDKALPKDQMPYTVGVHMARHWQESYHKGQLSMKTPYESEQ